MVEAPRQEITLLIDRHDGPVPLAFPNLPRVRPVPLVHYDTALRTASFSLEDRGLLWSRARLYADRMELVGWSLSGRYHRVIPLGRIEEAEATGDGLELVLTDGPSLRIGIDTPEQWATAIATHRDVREGAEETSGKDIERFSSWRSLPSSRRKGLEAVCATPRPGPSAPGTD